MGLYSHETIKGNVNNKCSCLEMDIFSRLKKNIAMGGNLSVKLSVLEKFRIEIHIPKNPLKTSYIIK